MGKQLISVIVPMYNVEKYISQCLESLIKQTYKNLEIIVIDDGSTDQSLNIAKRYAKYDNRVKVYSFANAGVSEARNRGLRLAKGDYIAFVDSDDWTAEDMYRILVEKMIKYDLDMIKCSVCESDCDNNTNKIIIPRREILKNKCDVGGTRKSVKKILF